MNLKTPNATLILGSALLVILTALGWFVVISPANVRLAESQEALASAADANAASQVKLAQLQRAEENLPTTRAAADVLTEIFPPTADQAQFFNAVTDAATDAGIDASNVLDLSPSTPQPRPDDAEAEVEPGEPLDAEMALQTVSLSVDATYPQAARMLANLEELSRAVFISSVAVSGEAGGGRVTISIQATTFVAPPLVDPADLPDTRPTATPAPDATPAS